MMIFSVKMEPSWELLDAKMEVRRYHKRDDRSKQRAAAM